MFDGTTHDTQDLICTCAGGAAGGLAFGWFTGPAAEWACEQIIETCKNAPKGGGSSYDSDRDTPPSYYGDDPAWH